MVDRTTALRMGCNTDNTLNTELQLRERLPRAKAYISSMRGSPRAQTPLLGSEMAAKYRSTDARVLVSCASIS